MNSSPDIFALGDVAAVITEETPNGHAMVAQPAIQQGENLGYNFKKILKGDTKLKPFKYFDKGSMATIGRNKAVADIGNFHVGGFIAWVMWLFIHVLFLVGFKNKIFVLLNWISSYFSYDKSNRLIIRR